MKYGIQKDFFFHKFNLDILDTRSNCHCYKKYNVLGQNVKRNQKYIRNKWDMMYLARMLHIFTAAFAKHLTNHFWCQHSPDVCIVLNKHLWDVCYFHKHMWETFVKTWWTSNKCLFCFCFCFFFKCTSDKRLSKLLSQCWLQTGVSNVCQRQLCTLLLLCTNIWRWHIRLGRIADVAVTKHHQRGDKIRIIFIQVQSLLFFKNVTTLF